MSAAPKKVGHRKPKQSYNMYVAKMLKNVDVSAGMQGDARAVASSMTAHLVNELANQTKNLMTKSGKKQVQSRDVALAASTLFQKLDHTDSDHDIKLALDAFQKNKKGSKSERAELIMPVARIHTMMKNQKIGAQVSPLAAVAVAAAVQGQMHRVFDIANNLRNEDKVVRVTAQHLKRAAAGKPQLEGIVKRGGVEEHIHEALVPKSKKRAASSAAPATKRAKK